jgi:hypothetical protein
LAVSCQMHCTVYIDPSVGGPPAATPSAYFQNRSRGKVYDGRERGGGRERVVGLYEDRGKGGGGGLRGHRLLYHSIIQLFDAPSHGGYAADEDPPPPLPRPVYKGDADALMPTDAYGCLRMPTDGAVIHKNKPFLLTHTHARARNVTTPFTRTLVELSE